MHLYFIKWNTWVLPQAALRSKVAQNSFWKGWKMFSLQVSATFWWICSPFLESGVIQRRAMTSFSIAVSQLKETVAYISCLKSCHALNAYLDMFLKVSYNFRASFSAEVNKAMTLCLDGPKKTFCPVDGLLKFFWLPYFLWS